MRYRALSREHHDSKSSNRSIAMPGGRKRRSSSAQTDQRVVVVRGSNATPGDTPYSTRSTRGLSFIKTRMKTSRWSTPEGELPHTTSYDDERQYSISTPSPQRVPTVSIIHRTNRSDHYNPSTSRSTTLGSIKMPSSTTQTSIKMPRSTTL